MFRACFALSAFALSILGALPARAEAPRILVAPARDTAEARNTAHALARALGASASVREVDTAADPTSLVAREKARALLVVDVAPTVVLLTAVGSGGKTWAPRTVERNGAETVVNEHVAAAARSIVAAVLAADDARNEASATPAEDAQPTATPPPAVPEAAPPAAEAPRREPVPTGETPVETARLVSKDTATPARATEPPSRAIRLDAGFRGSNAASDMPVQLGAGGGATWLRGPVEIGLAYVFFPTRTLGREALSFEVSRHVVELGAGVSKRLGDAWELGASAGPLLEVWHRSTLAAGLGANPTDSATFVGAGGFARIAATYWALGPVGLDAGIALEIAPASPHFRTSSGEDVLSPNLAKVRFDLGGAFAWP